MKIQTYSDHNSHNTQVQNILLQTEITHRIHKQRQEKTNSLNYKCTCT